MSRHRAVHNMLRYEGAADYDFDFLFDVHFSDFHAVAGVAAQALLLSWGFSIFQRFVINEPCLILLSKGVPMLFTSELCANVCGETLVNLLDLVVQGITTFIKHIKTG